MTERYPGPAPERCRSCKAPIRWVVMAASNKSMPLDYDPSPAGTVRIDMGSGFGLVVRASAVTPDETLYTSHFATCPNAGQHRRPR